MSTEQNQVQDAPEQVVTAAPVGADQNDIVIQEGQKVYPISEMYNNIEPNAVYLKPSDYEKYQKGELKAQPAQGDDEPGENGSSAPAQDQGSGEPAAQQSTFDEAAWLKEKTGGKFEKWEDLWSRAEQQPEIKFENDQSKAIFEYLQKGEFDKVGEVLMMQKALSGIDNASPEELIKMRMQIEEPDIDDVDFAFQLEYEKPDEENMDEDEYKKALYKYNRSLKKAAESAKEFLLQRKAEIVLPAPAQANKTQAPAADFNAEIEQSMASIHESVVKALPEVKEFSLQFNNNKDVVVDYKYSYSNQEKDAVATALKDYGSYFESRYATKDGGYDGQKLANDVLILENLPRILQSAVTDAIMKTRLEFINQGANYTNARETPARPVDTVKDQERKSVQSIFNG